MHKLTDSNLKNDQCPSCSSKEIAIFYQQNSVPVNSVLLLNDRDEAINFPTGDINLCYCEKCGFISNLSFDEKLLEYSIRYEGTQKYSPNFQNFNRNLANDLIRKYSLIGKDIIEIGCGNGEFITLLCDMGDNNGIGFDPSYENNINLDNKSNIKFIKDLYSEKYCKYKADFICCKMTLEHIYNVNDFVMHIRKSIGEKSDTIVFFQVPNSNKILQKVAFWDIYYEHCSYFNNKSISNLLNRNGFDILDLWTDYNDQYLMISAKPKRLYDNNLNKKDDVFEELKSLVENFSNNVRHLIEEWRKRVNVFVRNKEKAVIWGAGSKGVSFLTTIGIDGEIKYAVDINPHKKGTFMPFTGQEIVEPSFLKTYNPDYVILMNSIYLKEIKQMILNMGLNPKIISV